MKQYSADIPIIKWSITQNQFSSGHFRCMAFLIDSKMILLYALMILYNVSYNYTEWIAMHMALK